MPNPRILVLCTGNSARSQMAEGFFKKYVGDEFDVFSAGLDPKPIHPLAIQVMSEVGIDISQQYSKDVKQFLGQHFTYLITVCSNAEARCPIFPGVIYRLYWPFDDPAAVEGSDAQTLAKFCEIRDKIEDHIRRWMLEYKAKQLEARQRHA
jgi:arsenate reductase (thioredoxin)